MKNIKAFSHGTSQLLDTAITVCIVALFFGLPLFFLNATYQGITFEKQYYFYFWTVLGVIFWTAKSLVHGGLRIIRTSLDLPLLVLWVITGLSTLFSLDRYHSVFGAFGAPSHGFLALSVAILAYFFLSSHMTEVRTRLALWSFLCAGAVVTVWTFLGTIIGWFGLSSELLTRMPWGVGSLSVIVIFLAAMIPLYIVGFAFVSSSWRDNIKSKICSSALLMLLGANFFIFYSLFRVVTFAEWMIVTLVIAFFVVILLARMITTTNRIIAISLLSFLMLIVFLFVDRSVVTNTIAFGEHKMSWAVAKEALTEHPLLGSGPATYAYNFALYRPEYIGETRVPQMRSTSGPGFVMYTLSTMGILGVIAVIVVFLVFIGTTVRGLTQTKNATILFSLGLSATTMMIALPLFLTRFDGLLFLLSFLLLALSAASLRREKGEKDVVKNITFHTSPNHALARAFLYLVLAVSVLFGLFSLGKKIAADMAAAQGVRAQIAGDETEVSSGIITAARLNGSESRYFILLAENSLAQANQEAAKLEDERDGAHVERLIGAALGAAQKARTLAPHDVSTHETIGIIYESGRRYLADPIINARHAYEQARALEPRNAFYDLRLGILALIEAQGEETTVENQEHKRRLVEEAKVLFTAARDKDPTLAPVYYQLAMVHEALDDLDGAVTHMTTAQQLMPTDLDYAFNLARLLQARDGEGDVVFAERIFKEILGVNDQEINTQLNLGLLYERTNRRDDALTQYNAVLEILPEDAPARERIIELIATLENGGTNLTSGQAPGGDRSSDDAVAIENAAEDAGDAVTDERN